MPLISDVLSRKTDLVGASIMPALQYWHGTGTKMGGIPCISSYYNVYVPQSNLHSF